MSGVHTSLYRRVIEEHRDFLEGVGIVYDAVWADSTDRKAQGQYEAIEMDLQTNRQNLDKPKIRVGCLKVLMGRSRILRWGSFCIGVGSLVML